jgi:hypothetical protein
MFVQNSLSTVVFITRGNINAAELSSEIAERLGGGNSSNAPVVVDLLRQWPPMATAAAGTTALLRLSTAEHATALKRRLNSRLLSTVENITFLPDHLNTSKLHFESF